MEPRQRPEGEDEPKSPSDGEEHAYRELTALIAREEFRPGERIGTERDLSTQFDVGRTVLRRAIARLEREGRVQRWVGRTGGVYASDLRVHRELNTLLGVPELVRRQGRVLVTTVLSATAVTPPPHVRRALRLEVGAKTFRVERLRAVDGRSWSLDMSYVAEERFPDLPRADLTQSMFGAFAQLYGVQLDHVDETIEIAFADNEQARHLDIPVGTALFVLWRTTYDSNDSPVEFARDVFVADRTRVHMQKHGVNWKRTARAERH